MLTFRIKLNKSLLALSNIWLNKNSTIIKFFTNKQEQLALMWEISLTK
mgnify:CR=1 FL=1